MTRAINRRLMLSGFAAAGLSTTLLPPEAHAATAKKNKKRTIAAARSNYTPMPRAPIESGQPLHVVVSINEQKAHVYAGTQLIGSSRVSSAKPGHDAPQGIFTVMEKRRHHRSNIYSNAPMPYMQRLTWSGIALHEGHVPNHPASHGCVRLPRDFAADLFSMTTRNRHVVITGDMPQVHAVSSDRLFQPRL
jgi:lipoprotein-anchoring transpeptidase ErfK/SrfK